MAWSHDERSLLVFSNDDKGTYVSSWSFAARALTRVAGPRAFDAKAFFSPRDDFIAYTSQESGRPEVYVTTLPEPRRTWPLTTGGGQVIGWRKDEGEILVATLSLVTTTGLEPWSHFPRVVARYLPIRPGTCSDRQSVRVLLRAL